MRERVVQLARDLQALAHDGGVSGFLCQPLHLAGPHGHPAFELAAQRLQLAPLILKIAEDAGERARSWATSSTPRGMSMLWAAFCPTELTGTRSGASIGR